MFSAGRSVIRLLDIEHLFDLSSNPWLSSVKSHWTTSERRSTR
jgi:hypothetical protein